LLSPTKRSACICRSRRFRRIQFLLFNCQAIEYGSKKVGDVSEATSGSSPLEQQAGNLSQLSSCKHDIYLTMTRPHEGFHGFDSFDDHFKDGLWLQQFISSGEPLNLEAPLTNLV